MDEQANGDIYIYMGGDQDVPRNVTRVRVDISVKVISRGAFERHPHLVEFECHDDLGIIKERAFYHCPSLKRVKMIGVTVVESHVFGRCKSLTDVECDKLEIIGDNAFYSCRSLRSVSLPSIKVVDHHAFNECMGLTVLKFGDKLESIGELALFNCSELKRIAIPLKDGMITGDNVFSSCQRLGRVDLVGGVHETIAALQLERWRNKMNVKIGGINRVLPTVGVHFFSEEDIDRLHQFTGTRNIGVVTNDVSGKGQAVRIWIQSVLRKMECYKAKHRALLKEAATTLELALWKKMLCGGNTFMPMGDEEGRRECRVACGADMNVVVPNVLSFLKIE